MGEEPWLLTLWRGKGGSQLSMLPLIRGWPT